MPAVKAGVPAAGEQLVRIDELEDWAQLAFGGYKCAPAILREDAPAISRLNVVDGCLQPGVVV